MSCPQRWQVCTAGGLPQIAHNPITSAIIGYLPSFNNRSCRSSRVMFVMMSGMFSRSANCMARESTALGL